MRLLRLFITLPLASSGSGHHLYSLDNARRVHVDTDDGFVRRRADVDDPSPSLVRRGEKAPARQGLEFFSVVLRGVE